MKKMNMIDMMLIVGASSMSFIMGMALGCIKEKLKMNENCIIEEM